MLVLTVRTRWSRESKETKASKIVIISVQGMRNNMVDAESLRTRQALGIQRLGNCRCTDFVKRDQSLSSSSSFPSLFFTAHQESR